LITADAAKTDSAHHLEGVTVGFIEDVEDRVDHAVGPV
jgi:hypothetical protein